MKSNRNTKSKPLLAQKPNRIAKPRSKKRGGDHNKDQRLVKLATELAIELHKDALKELERY